MALEFVSPEIEIIGRDKELKVHPFRLPLPSTVKVIGSDVLLNVAFSLACLGFDQELLEDIGYRINKMKVNLENIDRSRFHYVGPYFRWEISGFWPTVEEEISLGKPSRLDDSSKEILKSLGIDNLAKRNPDTLSGGETAKLVLAAHLVHRPLFLVLDRILGELDVKSRTTVLRELKRLIPEGVVIFVDDVVDGSDYIVSIESEQVEWNVGSIDSITGPTSTIYIPEELTLEKVHFDSLNNGNELLIEQYNVERSWGQVFPPINYSAVSGDIIFLCGTNGCGKTTFLEGLAGFIQTTGRKLLKTKNIVSESKQFFSFSPQDPQCDITELTLQDELSLACNNKISIEVLLAELELPLSYLKAPIHEDIALQKLTSVLAATIRKRSCCLLDEPTLYLSQKMRTAVKRVIRQYVANGGIAICSTHDMEFKAALATWAHAK